MRMMEALESRQMFSVTAVDTADLAVDTSTAPADTSVTTEDVMANTTSTTFMKACCTGKHYAQVTVYMR